MKTLIVAGGIFGIIMAAMFCYEKLSSIPTISKFKTILAFIIALVISVGLYMIEMG